MIARTRTVITRNGLRISKALADQADLGDRVEIAVSKHQLVIRRAGRPRAGWAKAFRAMAKAGDDVLLFGDS